MTDIRAGAPEDAAALTMVANAAKRHWGYPEDWLRLWQKDLTVTDDYILETPVFVAQAGSAPIGFVALDMRRGQEEIDHLWVLPKWMGKGIGRRLMERALAHCREMGIESLWVASDPHAQGFYRGLGAVYEGEYQSRPAPRTIPLLKFDIHGRST